MTGFPDLAYKSKYSLTGSFKSMRKKLCPDSYCKDLYEKLISVFSESGNDTVLS